MDVPSDAACETQIAAGKVEQLVQSINAHFVSYQRRRASNGSCASSGNGTPEAPHASRSLLSNHAATTPTTVATAGQPVLVRHASFTSIARRPRASTYWEERELYVAVEELACYLNGGVNYRKLYTQLLHAMRAVVALVRADVHLARDMEAWPAGTMAAHATQLRNLVRESAQLLLPSSSQQQQQHGEVVLPERLAQLLGLSPHTSHGNQTTLTPSRHTSGKHAAVTAAIPATVTTTAAAATDAGTTHHTVTLSPPRRSEHTSPHAHARRPCSSSILSNSTSLQQQHQQQQQQQQQTLPRLRTSLPPLTQQSQPPHAIAGVPHANSLSSTLPWSQHDVSATTNAAAAAEADTATAAATPIRRRNTCEGFTRVLHDGKRASARDAAHNGGGDDDVAATATTTSAQRRGRQGRLRALYDADYRHHDDNDKDDGHDGGVQLVCDALQVLYDATYTTPHSNEGKDTNNGAVATARVCDGDDVVRRIRALLDELHAHAQQQQQPDDGNKVSNRDEVHSGDDGDGGGSSSRDAMTAVRSAYVSGCLTQHVHPSNVVTRVLAGALVPSAVHTLLLAGAQLGDSGVCALAVLLPRLPRLQLLDVARNDAHDRAVLALCDALHGHTALTLLSLCDNALSDDAARALTKLASALPQLCEVDVSGCALSTHAQAQLRAALQRAPAPLARLQGTTTTRAASSPPTAVTTAAAAAAAAAAVAAVVTPMQSEEERPSPRPQSLPRATPPPSAVARRTSRRSTTTTSVASRLLRLPRIKQAR